MYLFIIVIIPLVCCGYYIVNNMIEELCVRVKMYQEEVSQKHAQDCPNYLRFLYVKMCQTSFAKQTLFGTFHGKLCDVYWELNKTWMRHYINNCKNSHHIKLKFVNLPVGNMFNFYLGENSCYSLTNTRWHWTVLIVLNAGYGYYICFACWTCVLQSISLMH